MTAINILIADDHELFRRGLRALLESRSQWHVCGEAANGIEAVEKTRELRPQFVLMDISMPGMDGIKATRILAREVPESKVILVSQNDPEIMAGQTAEIGALAYVTKSQVSRDLIPTIEKLVSGNGGLHKNLNPGGENSLADHEASELERKLRLDAELLAAIVASSDDAIISKNLHGVITSWNKSAERIFGYTAQEAIGKHITLIIPEERLDEEAHIIERIRRSERVDHFQTVRKRKDGTTLNVSLTISPVKDLSGCVIGASKVARDITELKRIQEDYRKLAESLDAEVRARTRELEERNADVLRQSEQLRQISGRVLRTQDDERRHIARELHDSAGQTLAVLGMNLSMLVQKAGRKSPELAADAENIQALVQQLNREIRTASYLLHPPLLDESGLSSALSWYTQGLHDRSGLDVSLNISEDVGRLPRDMELVVFRVVQECLTNIHRHAGSKTASIRIARAKNIVTVEVQDQGKGISGDKLSDIQSRGAGVGIGGMRERLRQLNGELHIESNDSGTRVSATIPAPLNAADQDTGIEPIQAVV